VAVWLRCHSFDQLPWACALLQSPPHYEPPAVLSDRCEQLSPHPSGSSHEVCRPFSVSSHGEAASWCSLPHRTACALRFSQPLDASRRPVPPGPISCQIRSWGCTLQSFVPLAWPYAVSSAVPLLTFERPENTTAQATFTAHRSTPRVHSLRPSSKGLDRNRTLRACATSPLNENQTHRSALEPSNRSGLTARAPPPKQRRVHDAPVLPCAERAEAPSPQRAPPASR
jgi:hypothetical protein